MRFRRGSIEQAGVGKILDCHVSFRVSDAKLPAVDITLTRLGLDEFPVEFEPSAHMRAIIPTAGSHAVILRSRLKPDPTVDPRRIQAGDHWFNRRCLHPASCIGGVRIQADPINDPRWGPPSGGPDRYRMKRNTPRADDNASRLFESVTVLSPLSRLV